MKSNVYVLLFFLAANLLTAQVFTCRNGHVEFVSDAPLELIKAESGKAGGAVDCSTRNVAFSVDIDSFEGFNSELQKEHFRENYMETARYPKATFIGKIIEDVDFSKPGSTIVRAKGIFSIHGVNQEKIIKVKLNISEKIINAETSFDVLLEDHNIKIPKVVNQKIAPVINVGFKAALKQKA
jgi:hypothetical protein